jgi:hypothetical protein
MELEKNDDRLSKISRMDATAMLLYMETAHGFYRVRASSGILVKSIWLMCILTAWFMLIFHCNMIMNSYFAMPINTFGRINDFDDFEFPAVTICNLNIIRRSEIENRPALAHFYEFIQPDVVFTDVAEHLASKGRIRDMFYRTNVCSNTNKIIVSFYII